MRKLLSIAAFLSLSCLGFANSKPPVSSLTPYYASSYGSWQMPVTLGNAATGVSVVTVLGGSVVIPGGRQISPFNTNAALTVDSGANQETFTPTTIIGCVGYLPCQLFGNFTKIHGQGAQVISGTGGLQEAINDATQNGGGNVVVDNTWSGSTSQITGAAGNTNVAITDNRTGSVLYTWTGSAYAVSSGGTVTPAGSVFDTQTKASSSSLGNIAAPSTNGKYTMGYHPTAGVPVAGVASLVGLLPRAITGSTSSDPVVTDDCAGGIIEHDVAGSVSNTETVPTATSLLNANCVFQYTNHSSHADTITPTTWTIQQGSNAAASTLSVAAGVACSIKVDPNSSTNWLADCNNAGGSSSPTQTALVDSATITWTPTVSGSEASVTLGGNRTLNIGGNAIGHFALHVTQDGTGSRTLTGGTYNSVANKIFSAANGLSVLPLSTTAAFTDDILLDCDGTNCYASGLGKQYTASAPAGHTFTLVQQTLLNNACNAAVTTCSFTVTSTGAGHLLILMFANISNSGNYITSVSDGSDTWVVPSGASTCQIGNSSVGSNSCAYVLSSTAGITSVTITPTSNSSFSGTFYEYSFTGGGGVVLDTQNSASNTTNTSIPGVALTLSGTSDVIEQQVTAAGGTLSAISTYTHFTTAPAWSNAVGFADLLNTASGTAPTWTISPTEISISSAIAFK